MIISKRALGKPTASCEQEISLSIVRSKKIKHKTKRLIHGLANVQNLSLREKKSIPVLGKQ